MASFIELMRPSQKSLALAFDYCSVILGSLFIALLAQVSFPLPFSPVPLTLQTLGILLIGALLGSKKGALAVIAYIAEGSLGLPVFAGGAAGLSIGPLSGYLVGFVLSAFVVGYLLERGWKENYLYTFGALLLGSLLILATGMLGLSLFVGMERALSMGVYPFVLGDSLKVFSAFAFISSHRKFSAWRMHR